MEFSDKIIDKKEELLDEFQNLTLDQLAIKIKEISNRETDVIFQIACLAARVSVLNERIKAIMGETVLNDNFIENNRGKDTNIVEKILEPSPDPTNNPIEWVRVQIKETTEVNGVRFPSGIQIDVTDEDSKKMIDGGKAILLEDLETKESV